MRLPTPSAQRRVVQLRPLPSEEEGRHRMPAGGVIVVGLVCLLLWCLLDARSLYRSAQTSSLGTRRTAAIFVTRPLFDVSRWTGIDWVGSLVERGLGRNPDSVTGGVVAGPPPAPIAPASPGPAVAPSPNASRPAVLPPLRTPTAQDPLRITIMGDSFGADLGFGIGRTLGGDRYRIVTDGRISTGLTRPDYFNWITETSNDVSRYRPELVMTMIGANDWQNIVLRGVGGISYYRNRRAWIAQYRIRVDKMMDAATARGARLVWVGLPIVGTKPGLNDAIQLINRIGAEEAAKRQNALYLDSWHLFVNTKGRYSAYLPDATGRVQLMRAPDKVHLSPAGNEYLAEIVIGAVHDQWGFEP